MRKKVVSTLVAAITIMSMFAGCSGRTEEPAENPSGEISSQAEEDTQENIREEAGGHLLIFQEQRTHRELRPFI